MWLPILMLCSSPYIESCIVITGEQLLPSKEECFQVSRQKAEIALKDPVVYKVKPMCQIIPEVGVKI
tara:strand:- start:6365 stop:6565 length:201 start_codon:yes stop_codon:yes gene_type:complete